MPFYLRTPRNLRHCHSCFCSSHRHMVNFWRHPDVSLAISEGKPFQNMSTQLKLELSKKIFCKRQYYTVLTKMVLEKCPKPCLWLGTKAAVYSIFFWIFSYYYSLNFANGRQKKKVQIKIDLPKISFWIKNMLWVFDYLSHV